MREPTNDPDAEDLTREFEDLMIPHRKAPSPQSRDKRNEAARLIPRPLLDAILEIIAKTIEQALADVMTRCVGEGVEQKLRPLTEQVALLRTAIEHDWDDSGQPRRRTRPNNEGHAED